MIRGTSIRARACPPVAERSLCDGGELHPIAPNGLGLGAWGPSEQGLGRSSSRGPPPRPKILGDKTRKPFRDGWLADQREADRWIKNPGRIHLFGHVHEADSEEAWSGAGTNLIRITAGAVHGDKLPPGVPASHGYS